MPTVDIAIIIAAVVQEGHGEPAPEHRFDPKRRWRFDLAWVAHKVAFEREGGTFTGGRHTRAKGYRNDAEKYNAAAIAGWIVVRATVDMIRDGTALTQLLEALEVRQAHQDASC